MAVDITTLGIQMDTSDLRRGKKDLDAIGDSANKTAGKVTSFTSTATKALGAFAGAFAGAFSAVSVAQKLIETERATGILNSSLITATGSAEKAGQAFAAIQDLAGRLPESVQSVADAFIKMRNLGLDPSQKAIESYSNTAAAMGKSLNQMVEAVADAATGEFERLKEFGIKAKKQGDEVSLTFQGVTKTIGNSSEEITKYLQDIGNNNFAGAAAARMQTLDGAISNLQDSWDGLFRTINTQGAGNLITDTVRAAADAVQDLSDAIGSGQLAGYIDAYQSKFKAFADAGSMAFEMVRVSFDSMIQNLGAGNNVADFIVGAFRDMPENIAAFIQIAAVEIAVLVDKAMIYGEQIAWAMNPANWFDDMPDISGALDAVNDAREQTIAGIMQERDMALQSYDDQIKAADDLRLKYDEEKAAVVDLGKFKIAQAQETSSAIKDLNDETVAMMMAMEEMPDPFAEVDWDAYDEKFNSLMDSANGMGDAWSRSGSVIVDAFGSIIDSVDDYMAQLDELSRREQIYAKARQEYSQDPAKIKKIAEAEKKLASDRTKANVSSYRSIAGAASQMFDEQSKERKALHQMEQVFAAAEIALALQKSGANALTAITSAFAAPFPINFASGAAMIAIMAGLGVFSGGGGGGSAPSAADIQKVQGTGTVLGSDEKSMSIAASFSAYEDIALEQLAELRGIRDAVTGLNTGIALLARDFVSGQRFTGSEVRGLGTSQAFSVGDFAGKDIYDALNPFGAEILNKGFKDLFGSTKKSLKDSGLKFEEQELGDILSGNFEAYFYNTIETTKKKLFGLSKKTSTKDELTGLDAGFEAQIQGIFGYIGAAVGGSIESLGIESANALEDFKLNIGKVSFKDLSGEEIQAELEAIFSQQADLIAGYVAPALAEYQKMGEGLFETLTRIAAEMAAFSYYTDVMGLSINATGLSAIAVQQSIAELSGGMDKLTANMQTYYEEFFTEEERAANQMALLSAEMKNLGYDIVPGSREGFRNLVEAIDLTTESGQKQFAGLMSLSEVFADLIPETEALVAAQRSAADIAQERASLERQLLQVQGDTATLRAQDLAVLDASNQALQQQIWALQDQAIAAKEAETAARALEQAQKAIASERYNLEGQLLQAQGDTAAMRNRELEKLDESNRAIQLQIWALEDLAAANNLAAQSAAELASEQQRIADELAQKQNQIASERYGLETQLLQVQGKNDEIRARELLQLDESNRALQSQIWALEDQKASSEMAAKAAEKEAQEKERAADEQRKAQQRAADDAAKAQQKAMDDARKAAEEQRKLAQGVHDSISDALRSLMGESEAFNQMGMAQARQTLQGALGVAQKGGSLVGYAGLEDALGAIQNIDASRFSSAFEYNQAMGQNIGLLSQLEQYTRVNGSHANGLDYVPFDGYVAQLHKGERVMTSAENKGQGELIGEIRALRKDLLAKDLAENNKLLSLLKVVEKWDGDGLPLERVS